MSLSWTGRKTEQPTFKCNVCFNSTHRTSRSQSTHSQDKCEWFGHDFQVVSGSVGKVGANIALESWLLKAQIIIQISALFGTGAVYPNRKWFRAMWLSISDNGGGFRNQYVSEYAWKINVFMKAYVLWRHMWETLEDGRSGLRTENKTLVPHGRVGYLSELWLQKALAIICIVFPKHSWAN